jgi:TonB family protein
MAPERSKPAAAGAGVVDGAAAHALLAGSDPWARDSRLGWQLSVIVHIAFILFILVKSLVFPGDAVPVPPSLRVDIVGLPDMLKKDKVALPPAPEQKIDKLQEQLKAAEEAAKSSKPIQIPKTPLQEQAAPDEMVQNPKKAKTNAKETAKERADRERKLKSALDRIKSLSKITDEEPKNTGATGALVKGNRISKGVSLSAEARESMEVSYYDVLREHLQQRWELPAWLARQHLSAKVQLHLDARGRVTQLLFLKGSGNAQFDDEVKKAIQNSQPFPLPPEEIARSLSLNGVTVGFPL